MANKKIITIQIDAETGDVIDKLEDVKKTTKETSSEMEASMGGALGKIDSLTGGAITKVKGLIKGVKGVTLGMKSLKAAIASTGIGLLVIALGSLVAYFTSTKRGAERLERIMSGLSATFSVVTDRLSAFGETLINAFENPQQAIKDFGNSIKEFVMNRVNDVISGVQGLGTAFGLLFDGEFKAAAEAAGDAVLNLTTGLVPVAGLIKDNSDALGEMYEEIVKETDAAVNLTGALQNLTDVERELRVARAEGRAEIEKQKLIADDVTKSTEERLVAAQKAFDLEQSLLERELSAARQRVSIIAQQNALGESSAEDLDRLAEARIALAELEAGSTTRSIELQNKKNAIEAEGARQRLAAVKEFRDAQAAFEAEQLAKEQGIEADQEKLQEKLTALGQTEIEAVQAKYAALAELAHGNKGLMTQIEQAQANEIDAINAKSVANRKAQNQALANASLNVAGAAIGALISLNDAADKKSEAAKKKAFERDKKLKIAQAVITTIQGALGAFQQGMSTYPAPFGAIVGGVMAAISAAAGAAQIAKIKKTKYGGGGSTGGAPSGGGGSLPSGATTTPSSPSITGDIGEGETQGAIRAYVVSKETTDQQSRDQLVEDQAQLVE